MLDKIREVIQGVNLHLIDLNFNTLSAEDADNLYRKLEMSSFFSGSITREDNRISYQSYTKYSIPLTVLNINVSSKEIATLSPDDIKKIDYLMGGVNDWNINSRYLPTVTKVNRALEVLGKPGLSREEFGVVMSDSSKKLEF